jgi:hypothetical protein
MDACGHPVIRSPVNISLPFASAVKGSLGVIQILRDSWGVGWGQLFLLFETLFLMLFEVKLVVTMQDNSSEETFSSSYP